MVAYIRSDLDFILAQIKIAEAHAAGQPLYGPANSVGPALIPAYNLSWGLRTVDGTYNNLLHPTWGSADTEFPEPLGTDFRTIMVDADPGPGVMMVPVSYQPGIDNDGPTGSAGPSDVFDPTIRTISNLLVDQTLGNPSAILTALQRAGIVPPEDHMDVTAAISVEYAPLRTFFNDLADAQRANAAAQAAASASPNNQALQDAAAVTAAAVDVAQAALDAVDGPLLALLSASGIELQGANIVITNAAPDEGLSAPFNSWFTLFGQFFDHGLDLVAKGGNGTVFIPLMPDDPLYVEGGQTNFMVLTRATLAGPGADGVMGTGDDTDRPVNTTTSFVDQNQTYTSHSSHQVFLREYVLVGGRPVATGNLIEGSDGGMATWGEVKAQAREMLGIDLTDYHVGNLPLLATDEYGNFIPNPLTGFPQVVMVGPPQTLASGTPGALLSLVTVAPDGPDAGSAPDVTHLAVRTGHAFLADIAHDAVPEGKIDDGDTEIGLANPGNGSTEYDNELLDAHFIAGDGRANENIGLTAVHHVFHAEHNRLVQHTKDVVLASGDLAFINEWLATDLPNLAAIPTTQAGLDALNWDGERLFQAAKFGTEMQYQHLVFEEFARKIQPNINVFLVPDGFDVTIDPSIVAEFAHVVYRFGHSMLTESIDRLDPNFVANDIGLIEGFLNPLQFHNNGTNAAVDDGIAAGAIIRGMTRQVGNEIDEFVTSALRNNLLGLPLDLATINLARGRDTGVPSLNEARSQFYTATNQDVLLKPYESWVDFAGHLKHEASIINFIAAYGTHSLITDQDTIDGKRDAALTLITGVSVGGLAVQGDAVDFLNGTGAYGAATGLGGLNDVDLWIGGLAEAIMPFGGMLGSTFNFVFEMQMEKLQNGDRFYYLQRLDGLHLFGEMENNSFAAMIMRNTDATHLPSDVFSTPGLILEVDKTKQYNPGIDDPGADGILLDNPGTAIDETLDNIANNGDPVGTGILTPLVIRNNPATVGPDTNYLRYTGGEHVVLGGTEGNNILIAGIGDDTLFGDGGNDRLEGGFGNDIINAGDGDDIIVDSGGDDNIKAGKGNDVVHAGPGLDLVMGNDGQDFIFLGTDMGSEVFAGMGNDFIYGNKNAERILGNEGNDWIETGTFDGAPGDNFDEIFAHDGVDGHDVFLGDGGFDEFIGEGGDDIFVGSPGRGKMAGMSGFDWATYKDNTLFVNADLSIPIIFDEAPTLPQNAALDEFESVEGLSGTAFNDILTGSDEDATTRLPLSQGGSTGYLGSGLDAQGIAMIAGLQAVVGAGVNAFSAGDIILGGDGSDVIMGKAGDDIIDGDKWLNVRIGIMSGFDLNGPTGTEVVGNPNIKSMTSLVTLRLDANGNMVTAPTGGTPTTKPLSAWMFEGKINPGQLQIVREITTAGADAVPDIDTAKFQGLRSEYSFGATADGQVIVTDITELNLDGSDRLRNIERVQFSDGGPLNIVVGTPYNDNGSATQGAPPLNQPVLNGTAGEDLILGLAGTDVLNGLGGNDILVGGPGSNTATYADNFETGNANNTNGSTAWTTSWVETGDSGAVTTGQIQIDGGNNNVLRFVGGTGANFDGAQIQRTVNLAGTPTAFLSYSVVEAIGADDNVTVFFSRDGTTFVQVDQIISTTGNVPRNIDLSLFGTGPFTASAAIRFVATSLETGDSVNIDNLTITYVNPALNAGVDTLNGGLGNDTYSFGLGDGNDTINEAVNATSGGTADRIAILAPNAIDPVTLLPVPTLTSLNASDNNTADNNGSLVITYGMPNGAATVNQTITVAGHYTGTNLETGVERINFNGATYAGYLLGADDYLISRLDVARDSGGVNLSASTVNNFIAGEDGVADVITGGLGNDLIFGGTGDNDLIGGDGDDLLVGGSGTGDDDFLDGGLGADTMIGLAGNDDYVVDDLLDVVVEAGGAGTDEVLTEMAALSIELMANVENLTYTGIDADQFVGTGNSIANVISGGDLADTLSGLGGNDTLLGGLGADIMIGGDGNDVYEVDEAGDVVTETTADAVIGGTDRVESDISFVLGANVENLDLNGADADLNGTGNALNNVINGNDGANQLFGGAGNDTLNGNDDNDLIDGGLGNDTINGGDNNDTIIGNAGDDTIDVGGGVNTIVYNTSNFGADIINSFDADGGLATNQDKIDLSGLGITAANFATRVTESAAVGAPAGRLLTINDGASNQIGTIRINNVTDAQIDINDFTLAAAVPTVTINGTNLANTLNGVGTTSETINALGGNDTVNANGGNDVVNGGEGTDLLNGGDGNDTLSGGSGSDVGTYRDEFGSQAYTNNNGTLSFNGDWIEGSVNVGGSETGGATGGDITINTGNGGRLQFNEGVDGGEYIQRAFSLPVAASASVQFTYVGDTSITGTENVTVQAWNHTTNSWQALAGGVLGTTSGTFNATLSAAQIGPNSAIRLLANGDWDDGDNFFIENFTVTATAVGLNAGVDTVNGDAGDDTIIWNANALGATDGRDVVDGGTEGAVGDTFVVNGNASAEVYNIYTRAAWQGLGNSLAGFNAATEIIVARGGLTNANVIAELREIEEIRINSVDPTGATGTAGNDTFNIAGDFSTTSLRLNTITIDGDAGDDTIDITSLNSAHRIVFRSNGGNDTIIGTLRPQDVIELPVGETAADYVETVVNGVTTLTKGNHSISYVAAGAGPQVGPEDEEELPDNEEEVPEDDVDVVTTVPGVLRTGTADSDTLVGTTGDDNIIAFGGDDVAIGDAGADAISLGDGADFANGGAGRDVIFAGAGDDQVIAGADADIVYGDAGADRIFGEQGNDLITAGAGDDTVFGGDGDDMFVAETGDGDDVYFGDDSGGGTGRDTLDMSAATAAITVNLGTGALAKGSALSGQTGSDTLWGIENVNTGSGADTITASNAVNVMDGGAGNDVFKFVSVAAANGDTILGFEPGDRLDLSGIDANTGTAADQSFSLVTGAAFTAAGQLAVSYETRSDGEYTLITGNVDGNTDADFSIAIEGHQNLTNTNLNL
ncbi:MAG: peroxidase family protein [Afipia sp.]|nr:peroxidase family protein [Afipia sp.]